MLRIVKISMNQFKQILPSPTVCRFLRRHLHAPHIGRPFGQKTLSAKFSTDNKSTECASHWPRKIFSGIQPTGTMHLGNYLGAVQKWIELQNNGEDVTICIVDMHSITMPQDPPELREHIFKMAAMLLACGVDPNQTTLFVQSSVVEHSELNWILNCMTSLPRLAQLPQFKEKSRRLRDVPLGLYVYPVLQAADIMLYKSTHVPVGIDQLQHIQLTQHLARSFNNRYGEMFPVCHALIDNNDAARIRSLRDPTHKMSKSDLDKKATIYLNDEPEVITEKIKKAVTDFNSDISYDPSSRPGVSNLIAIHSQVTGQPIPQILDDAKSIDTGKYKMRVAKAVVEHLQPIREKYNQHLARRNELVYLLEIGAEKARQTAQQTINEVKQRLGLGIYLNMPQPVELPVILPEVKSKLTASQKVHRVAKASGFGGTSNSSNQWYDETPTSTKQSDPVKAAMPKETVDDDGVPRDAEITYKPRVPIQKMRVEKAKRSVPHEMLKSQFHSVGTIKFRSTINSVYTSISPQPSRIPVMSSSKKNQNVQNINNTYGNITKPVSNIKSSTASGSNYSAVLGAVHQPHVMHSKTVLSVSKKNSEPVVPLQVTTTPKTDTLQSTTSNDNTAPESVEQICSEEKSKNGDNDKSAQDKVEI